MKEDSHSKFDKLLTSLGTGKWNIIHFIGAGFWYMLMAPPSLNVVYYAPALEYICKPNPHHDTSYIANDSCSYFRWDSGKLVEEQCTEWHFDNSTYTSTLTSEFGLVCGKAYLRATYQSVFMISNIVGSLITGYLADRYGRKRVTIAILCTYTVLCNTMIFLNNFIVIIVYRIIMGAIVTHSFYLLGMEVCEIKHRSKAGQLMLMPWIFGEVFMGTAAYFIRDWRYLQLTVSLPFLLLFPLVYLTNESPRWLMIMGREKEALRVMKRAARLNKTSPLPEDDLKALISQIHADHIQGNIRRKSNYQEEYIALSEKNVMEVNQNSPTWRQRYVPKLFSTPKMILVLISVSLQLFIASMTYYWFSLSGAIYTNNPFLYLIIGGLAMIPAYLFLPYLMDRFGRRYPAIISFTFTGLIIIPIYFTPRDMSWLVLSLFLLGKLGSEFAFLSIYVYQAEIIPTEVRVQGFSLTYRAVQVGAALVPFVQEYLGSIIPWLPSLLFTILSLIAAASIIPLPESKGKNLPDAVADLEYIWKEKKNKSEVDHQLAISIIQ